MKAILGIDPGRTGGCAWIKGQEVDVFSFTGATDKEILNAFRLFWERDRGMRGMIEAVGAFPGQGVHSMFVFGMGYGRLQGYLEALGVPYNRVSPVTWKKSLGLARKTGKTDRKERKRLSRQAAQRLYPHVEVDDSTAEALLIAHYGVNLGWKPPIKW